MLRLMKLAVYAGAAYALYEVVQGLLSDPMDRPSGQRDDLDRALNANQGRMQSLTGPGMGMREETLDAHGESIPHQVGRGVLLG